ncbi:hypothetical protein HY990_07130 [Candidatus Micrarchaeota archaeon]|nr:hypothetical protein [Candidatus Micrarchaeota archaeon]
MKPKILQRAKHLFSNDPNEPKSKIPSPLKAYLLLDDAVNRGIHRTVERLGVKSDMAKLVLGLGTMASVETGTLSMFPTSEVNAESLSMINRLMVHGAFVGAFYYERATRTPRVNIMDAQVEETRLLGSVMRTLVTGVTFIEAITYNSSPSSIANLASWGSWAIALHLVSGESGILKGAVDKVKALLNELRELKLKIPKSAQSESA